MENTSADERRIPYLRTLNYHNLTNEEKNVIKEADEYESFAASQRDEATLRRETIAEQQPEAAMQYARMQELELEVQERTARSVYEGLVTYSPEEPSPVGPVTVLGKILQLFLNVKDMVGLPTVGELFSIPIKALNLYHEQSVRAEIIAQSNIEGSAGNTYPSLEEKDVVKPGEVVCADNVVRLPSTTEHSGYDSFHKEDTEFTVEAHNTLTESLKETTQPLQDLDMGAVVLWNAGGWGKNFVVDFGTKETV